MPANVGAILKKAEVGAELTCRAHEKEFDVDGATVRRGVISYYASATLTQAQDKAASWLHLIEQMSATDVVNMTITAFYQPSLQLSGDLGVPLVGRLDKGEI